MNAIDLSIASISGTVPSVYEGKVSAPVTVHISYHLQLI